MPSQSLQNFAVKLAIDGLTRGYEFLVDNSLDVGKNDKHGLDTLFSGALNLATSTATTAA
jgi:hypothetical protein